MALQDLLDEITADEADKQALIGAKAALASALSAQSTVNETSSANNTAAQADVDAKTKAVNDAAAKLTTDQARVTALVNAEFDPAKV